MVNRLLAVLLLLPLPSLALADPGSGGDLDRVRREVEAMQRDGRWEQLIAEGQANKQAFVDQRQASQPVEAPTATGAIRARARQSR